MEARVQIVAVIGALCLLFVVLEMVRRRRLLERYALLWLLSAVVILALAVWRGALEQLAKAVGIYSPPNALFFIALGFVMILLLHFSAAVSRLSDQSKVLAQRQAILEEALRQVQLAGTEGADEVDRVLAAQRPERDDTLPRELARSSHAVRR
jgi:hypothetical protein